MEKGKVVESKPQVLDLADGSYAWCACGLSSNQPWCDGSHKGTGLRPKLFKMENAKKAAICMCKQTSNPPYCDGSHSKIAK